MASNSVLVLAVALLPSIVFQVVLAKDYVVGDDKGWTVNFDYEGWAKDKQFKVGDKLVFKYPEGIHNVLPVDEAGFKNCEAPANAKGLATGKDVVDLATPGKKWFICGVGKHCEGGGQKLAINVGGEKEETSSAIGVFPFVYQYQSFMVAAIVAIGVFVVV